ncbi:MAG: tetratricopeptide repeat protein [bacterium]|nr:tetratricopeptide repeat protein [bacterium]
MTHRLYILLATLLLLSGFASSQTIIQQGTNAPPKKAPVQRTAEQVHADRARREEQRGSYDTALSSWLEVLKLAPFDQGALAGVPNCYVKLRNFAAAESFLNDQLAKAKQRGAVQWQDPASEFQLTLALGEVQLAAGDTDGAWKLWNEALSAQPHNPDAVRSLISVLQRNRRWDESEKLIRDYRKEMKNAGFMALELASSLQAQMNFAGATEELLLYSKSSPTAWQISQSYLSRFPDDTTVQATVLSTLETALKRDKKEPTLWRIYAGYSSKAGLVEESLNATITADSLTDSNGTILLGAAQQMLGEGEIALARRGFEKVLSWKPADEIAERADLGLAQCHEAQGEFELAKAGYEKFLSGRPRSAEVEEAKFRIAEILLTHDNKPADALAEYTGISQRAKGPLRQRAGLRIGDAHAYLGEYGAAIEAWNALIGQGRVELNDDVTASLLRIARANLWRDSTELADKALEKVLAGSTQNVAFNDAILYQALLSGGGFHGALRAFADADYASFRNDHGTAARKYSEAASMLRYGRLAEWSRMSEAEALRSSGRPLEAIAALDTFAVNFPESIDLPKAKYLQAVITLEDLQQEDHALELLEDYLIDYPRSMYLEQARRKARVLANKIS